MPLTRQQLENIKIARATGDNDHITIIDTKGNIINLNVLPDGSVEIADDYRKEYWEIRSKVRADDFAQESCITLPTLRKWEHGEQVTKMSEEKIKACIRRYQNGK